MSVLRRIANSFHRSKLDKEIEAELSAHIEMRAADNVAAGMSPDEARREALLRFGNRTVLKERVTAADAQTFVDSLWQDLRYGLRMLRKSPGFTAVAILTLALGIGAVTLIFSAVYGVILNTFPFRDASQVTSFTIADLNHPGRGREFLSVAEFLYFREHSQAFEDFSGEYGGFGATPERYTTRNATYQFDADFLSVNSFQFFGIRPLVGRLPAPADVKPGATPVFVMGYKLWHGEFNSDPNVVGKSFTLNGVPTTLVGIMPPRFRWAWVDVWVPFSVDPAEALTKPGLKNQFLYTVGRLKPGVSLSTAAADLNVVAHQYAKIAPADYPKRFTVTATSLSDRVTGGFKELMYPLLAAVFMLLLIACSNIANLLLSRATAREKEMAIRASLGASRLRLIRQLLVESLLLAMAGCLVGCLFAWLAIKGIVPLIPYNTFPQEAVISLNGPVLGAALLIAMFSTILCGIVPALHSVRDGVRRRVAGDDRGSDLRSGKLRSALVITEVSLGIVLLVCAGLMMRTFWNIKNVDLGFDPHNILAEQLSFSRSDSKTDSSQQTEAQQTEQENVTSRKVLEQVESLPGVARAALASSPPAFEGFSSEITIPGKTHAERWTTRINLCSEQYFELLHLRLLSGKVFSRGDIDLVRPVAVISATFAHKYFGADNAVGQSIHFAVLDQLPNFKDKLFEIIGVVSDVGSGDPRKGSQPQAYIPYTLVGANEDTLLVGTLVPPASLIPTIRTRVWAIDSNLALLNPATIDAMLQRAIFSSPQFEFVILTAFAAIALGLLMAGIFSVMAYTVSLRTHEIGVRMALGAKPEAILRMMLLKGVRLVLVGVGIGVGASLAVTKLLQEFLFGVRSTDPATFLGVSAFVVLVAVLACWIPARRAMKVDPMVALRYE